jgi:UDPglucose 6-dehydrogenase
MNVSIIGTGYVGLVSGTCFAELGHHVTCIDIDVAKIAQLKDGKSPIYEPGLSDLIERNIKSTRLEFSTSFESVKASQAVFIAVGTPSGDDGRADLKYIYSALSSLAPHLSENGIVIIKSTVPVGTCDKIRSKLAELTKVKFHIVNNPEFLKEGAAISDFMKPDRVVIGHNDDTAAKVMEELYEPLVRQGNPIYMMSNLSAEMTKYAANCFLATKISFINEIARLCDATNADIGEVRSGITSDKRIGSHFLYPGPGYGGSCFPKDVKALVSTAIDHGMNLKIVEAVERVNAEQKSYIVEKIIKHFDGELSGKVFGLWGVAFKPNTDDIREAPAISISKALNALGAKVKYYDPVASTNFSKLCESENIDAVSVDDKYECLKDCDGMVLVTEWPEFRTPDFKKMQDKLNQNTIFDARNILSIKHVKEANFQYYAIGRRI